MANTSNKNPGNFANDREKAAEAGRKGGQHTQGKGSESGHKGSEKSGDKSGGGRR